MGSSPRNHPSLFTFSGQPYISCQRDRIVIEVITERLFTGKVFVKGDYANSQCTRTFRNGAVITDNDKKATTDEGIFLGTVTKSREPYVGEQRKSSLAPTSSGKPTPRDPDEPLVKSSQSQRRFEGLDINSAPDIAETFMLPRKNETVELEDGEWKGVGGASAGPNAIFGGTRGEELRIFGKSVTPATAKRRGETVTAPPLSSECPPCEPCFCEERRTRRATNSIRLEVPLNSCNTRRDRKVRLFRSFCGLYKNSVSHRRMKKHMPIMRNLPKNPLHPVFSVGGKRFQHKANQRLNH